MLSPYLAQQGMWATASCVLFWTLVSAGMRIPPWLGIAYPAGALMTLYIVARSTIRGHKRVEWKGRTYGEAINQQGNGESGPR